MFSNRKKNPETTDDVILILRADAVVRTIETLRKRIDERFKTETGLSRVCGQLLDVARKDRKLVARLERPYVLLRLVLRLMILVAALMLVAVLALMPLVGTALEPTSHGENPVVQFFVGIEAALQLVIFIVAWIRLLPGAEAYFKRRRALPALRALRSIVHVIDMHQLGKDPSRFIVGAGTEARTSSSPTAELNEFQMTRYLDYCSEMLSLTAKVAALFGQVVNDQVVAEMVSEIERLSGGLSQKIWQKIWQKIMILQQLREREAERSRPDAVAGA